MACSFCYLSVGLQAYHFKILLVIASIFLSVSDTQSTIASIDTETYRSTTDQKIMLSNITSSISTENIKVFSNSVSDIRTTILSTSFAEASTTSYPPLNRKSTVRNYPWVIALIVISSLGILVVLALEITILLRIYGTSLWNNWKSMWLGQVLLFAIFCSYLTQYAFLPFPSRTTCYIIRFCVGVSYAMAFSVLVVKLLVILSPAAERNLIFQAALFLALWAVQLVIDIQWLISNHAYTPRDLESQDGLVCLPGYTEHVQSLVYVMFLIVLSLLLSFPTHRKRNPGKFVHIDGMLIGISAGLSGSVWIVWILLGFLKNNKDWHDPCIAFGLVTTATILLFFMIVPKVYHLKKIRKALLNDVDSSHQGSSYAKKHPKSNHLKNHLESNNVKSHSGSNHVKKNKTREFVYEQESNRGSLTSETVDKINDLVPRSQTLLKLDHNSNEVVTVHQTNGSIVNGEVKQRESPDERLAPEALHVDVGDAPGESRMFYQVDSSQYDSEPSADTRISHKASGRYQQSGLRSNHPQWGTLNAPVSSRRGSEGQFKRSSSHHTYHYRSPRGQAPPPYHEPDWQGSDNRYRVAALYSSRPDSSGMRRWNLSEPDLTVLGQSSSSNNSSPGRYRRSMERTSSMKHRHRYNQPEDAKRPPVITSVITISH